MYELYDVLEEYVRSTGGIYTLMNEVVGYEIDYCKDHNVKSDYLNSEYELIAEEGNIEDLLNSTEFLIREKKTKRTVTAYEILREFKL